MSAILRKPYFRLVDRYEILGGAGTLKQRVAEVVPEEADYVILDLDRTVHRDVTIGEQLGWEIVADRGHDHAHRQAHREELSPILSFKNPLTSTRNFSKAIVRWGPAGLVYLATVRAGERWPSWGRMMTAGLGAGYVDRVQALMRTILMMNSAGYTPESLRHLAARAWQRWSTHLVVDRDAIDAIRSSCPRLKAIVLSSASTEPTVSHAAEELGVDGYISSTIDTYDDSGTEVLSAPVGAPAWAFRRRARFFSRPGAVVHNSSKNKISFLRMHFPQIFDPGTVSVGITDNSHSEDSAWADHLSHVVALNSRHPFSPYVRSSSPCVRLSIVDADPVGPAVDDSRVGAAKGLKARAFDAAQLAAATVGFDLTRLEELTQAKRRAREQAAEMFDDSMRRAMTRLVAGVSEAVARYNAAASDSKPAIARELHRMHGRVRKLRAKVVRAGREVARIEFEIEMMRCHAAQLLAVRDS